MSDLSELEGMISEFHVVTTPETDRRILKDASATLEHSAGAGSLVAKSAFWSRLLTTRVVELAAVAAVVAVTTTAVVYTYRARGVTLDQVHEAIQEAENLNVATIQAGQPGAVQERLVSRTAGAILLKTEMAGRTEFALWDAQNRVRKNTTSASTSVTRTTLSEDLLAEVEESITQDPGLVAFSALKEAPEDSRWTPVKQKQLVATVPGCKVYDLTWPEKSAESDSPVGFKRLRLFVDARTHLPKRTELYWRDVSEDEYALQSSQVVTYPRAGEVRALIRDVFGPDNESSEPGYIPTPHPGRDY